MPFALTVLGIDAAWTEHNPSGVALVGFDGTRWRCLTMAPSYAQFARAANGAVVDWFNETPTGGQVDAGAVVIAATKLAGGIRPSVVAVDMPISDHPDGITGRRQADRLISQRFGATRCAAHSPTPNRPGTVGTRLHRSLKDAGFTLRTSNSAHRMADSLIEVYPHPPAMVLAQAHMRVPYKVAKTSRYAVSATRAGRRTALREEWDKLLKGLHKHIEDVPASVLGGWREGDSLSFLKRYEDALDALICAFVAIEFLDGNCTPLGDEKAAIWVPNSALTIADAATAPS